MHDRRVGDRIPFRAQFCGPEEKYEYVVKKEFVYPDGGIGYGVWSPLILNGRLMVQDCKCPECAPFIEAREKKGEKYFSDREGNLLKKRWENNKWVTESG